jgi:hypothetical protein
VLATLSRNKLPEEALETIRKIQELARYREEQFSKNGKIPNFKPACAKIGVSSDTVKRHDPDLFLMWYDEKYHSDIAKTLLP